MTDHPQHLDGAPLDSDVEVDDDPGRPVHLRWSSLGLVALGGAVGTGIREALALTWPAPAGAIPVTILLINVVGAFVLGALLESLARRGPDEGRRRAIRLLVGTGVLGGFTTYSSLATDAASLTGSALGVAFAYAGLSLVVGAAASAAGIAAGAAIHRRTAAGRATGAAS
ncbi:CrcB family protein [Clavibacter michiganensis]|uniref:fluoride efflux transporter FluC n=1 Tax=Clavibacter michiganensis TaxID=28447 RepID=UPI0026DD7180|nr:CrcB family protein [Clavibacter michiganensis]MDO4026634.1 CrcB family protein [Clavibacter michiganensis]MDO4035948.1 CrcB family protein [Clavibacter michiganensis]MDO4047552.1 CrcB family protein [Clavibacter michiganensis]MDO4075869.1 CrcB family protein [Clavibacter michiganensis]MDO4106380.1 CrcB family protein [Clavibacter michiganensis]